MVMRMLYFLLISMVRCELQLCFKVIIYHLGYNTACAGIMLFLLSWRLTIWPSIYTTGSKG